MSDSYEAGMKVRREVLGDAHVDRAIERTTEFTAPFQEFITRYAWGSVWTREGLDRRTRSAVTLSVLTALGRENEIEMHVRGALRNGLTPAEIGEVLLHTAIYAGVPAANAAFAIAQRVIDAEDPAAAGGRRTALIQSAPRCAWPFGAHKQPKGAPHDESGSHRSAGASSSATRPRGASCSSAPAASWRRWTASRSPRASPRATSPRSRWATSPRAWRSRSTRRSWPTSRSSSCRTRITSRRLCRTRRITGRPGARRWARRSPSGFTLHIPKSAVASTHALLGTGVALETAFVETYLGAVKSFSSTELKLAAAKVAANEATHFSFFDAAFGGHAVLPVVPGQRSRPARPRRR